jgi:cytochrome c553
MDRLPGRTAIHNRAPRRLRRRGGGRGAQAAPDTSPKRLAGSNLEFTLTQIRDGFGPADWFPGDHPTMPEIVAHGGGPKCVACALCHYPNGKGRAENAPIAGYPVAYFIQQMNDFKSGNRKSADPKKGNTNAMIAIAKAMTDEEIKATAEVLRIHGVDAVDQGSGDGHGAEDAHRGRPVPGAPGRREGADRQAHY